MCATFTDGLVWRFSMCGLHFPIGAVCNRGADLRCRQEFEWVRPAAGPAQALRALFAALRPSVTGQSASRCVGDDRKRGLQRNQPHLGLGDRRSAKPRALRTTSRHRCKARRSRCSPHRDAVGGEEVTVHCTVLVTDDRLATRNGDQRGRSNVRCPCALGSNRRASALRKWRWTRSCRTSMP